jgi:hypothetical protein
LFLRRFGACLDDGPVSWALAVVGEIGIQTGRPLESIDIFMDDLLAEDVQVEIVLIADKKK